MRLALHLFLPLALLAGSCFPAPGQGAGTGSRAAAVLVRVTLDEGPDVPWTVGAAATRREGPVTGSGFFVGRSGFVLTSAALVAPPEEDVVVISIEVVVTEGVVEPDPAGIDDDEFVEPEPVYETRTYEASVVEIEPELGVALLEIDPDGEIVRLPLGDSNVAGEGARLRTIGRGERGAPAEAAVTVRSSRESERQGPVRLPLGGRTYPGAEGGALVDSEGYALGVVVRGEDGTGLYAVPINAVKEFLAVHPPASELPWQLVLGPTERLDDEAVLMPLVEGLWDTWPGRTRFESEPDPLGVTLRVERLASPLDIGALEARLLEGEFGTTAAVRASDGSSEQRTIRRSKSRLLGSARAERDGVRYAIEYLIARVEDERIVASYEAPEELAAYNRSLLWDSLGRIQVVRLLMHEISEPVEVRLQPARLAAEGGIELVMPAGWYLQPVVEVPPADLPPPDEVLSASAPRDYTVSFDAYYWSDGRAVEQALGQTAGLEGEQRIHGVNYWTRTGSVPVGSYGTLALECRAPLTKRKFVERACGQWQSAVFAQLTGSAPSD